MAQDLKDMGKRQLKSLYHFAELENQSRTRARTYSRVQCLEVTKAIPQPDGTTLWRIQFTPMRLAAAMNIDRVTQQAILARRAQPDPKPSYKPPPWGIGNKPPRPILRDPPPVERDYGPDDPYAEAAALRYG